jgi:hypothetical protein
LNTANHIGRWFTLVVGIALLLVGSHGQGHGGDLASPPLANHPSHTPHLSAPVISQRTIVFSTIAPPTLAWFNEYRLIYTEAFKRLGYDFEMIFQPGERALVDADNGQVDGEAGRIADLNPTDYPNLIRVEEPIDIALDTAYSTDATIRVQGYDSLKGKGYVIGLFRGIKSVEQKLPRYVRREDIVVLGNLEQSLAMLADRRIDLFISADWIERSEILTQDRFKQIKRVGILETKTLYPWLLRRHADLAPKLAETLKQLKREGFFPQPVRSGE